MTEKLKKCPFCNSDNIVIRDSANGVDEKVWCMNCQANIPRFRGRRKELIKLWNTRAEDDDVQEGDKIMKNKGLLKLQENIQKLIDAGYEDVTFNNFVADSADIDDLNEFIEDELSYAE
nr:MAG TPA: restriction alleviation protein [Caudoviricetes sp.]